MMIALVTDEYPPGRHTGGIGSYTRNLARLLSSEGHEVHVFCQDDGIPKQPEGEVVHTVMPWEPPSRLLRYAYFRCAAPLLHPLERRARWGVSVARRIVATERTLGRNFDVVEIPESGGYAGFIRVGGVRSPILIRLHLGTASMCRHAGRKPDYTTRMLTRLERWSLTFGNLVSAPSRAILREAASDRIIGLRMPCVVYPSPLPRKATSLPCGRDGRDWNRILAVGKLSYLKGTDLVLHAFRRLQTDVRDLELVMIGRNIAVRDDLLQLISDAASGGVCRFTGELDAGGVEGWMNRAGMVVVASRFENFPTVVLEALQRGCLVVASDAGGIPEIVTDGQTGLLFRSGSASDLIDKIRWALEHTVECETIREAGQAWIEDCLSDKRVVDSVMRAYRAAKTLASAPGRALWRPTNQVPPTGGDDFPIHSVQTTSETI